MADSTILASNQISSAVSKETLTQTVPDEEIDKVQDAISQIIMGKESVGASSSVIEAAELQKVRAEIATDQNLASGEKPSTRYEQGVKIEGAANNEAVAKFGQEDLARAQAGVARAQKENVANSTVTIEVQAAEARVMELSKDLPETTNPEESASWLKIFVEKLKKIFNLVSKKEKQELLEQINKK